MRTQLLSYDSEKGATLVEYSLSLTVLCFGLIFSAANIGNSSSMTFYSVGSALAGDTPQMLIDGGGTGGGDSGAGAAQSSGGGTQEDREFGSVSGEEGEVNSPQPRLR